VSRSEPFSRETLVHALLRAFDGSTALRFGLSAILATKAEDRQVPDGCGF
jgi:hypothetical protein